jgi:FMN phosphatase YigB (HAD superfamily)
MKLLAFDLFGTIFDVRNGAKREDLRSYGEQIERNKTDWQPFKLPDEWENLPVFPDAAEGIRKLRERFFVVTMSNAPAPLQMRMLRKAGISFDGITPLELFRASKPVMATYTAVQMWGVPFKECGMVTANKDFGDLEASEHLGMRPLLIRGEEFPTLLDMEAAL